MTRALETRLRKLEALRRPADGVFFAVWGRDAEHLAAERARLDEAGILPGADLLVCAVWPFDEPMPAPRWIPAGGMTPIEEDGLVAEMQRRGLFELIDDEPAATAQVAARLAQMTDEDLTRAILIEGTPA